MPTLVYDLKQKRPGCALLQVIMGGDIGIAGKFPTEHWLLAPTESMKPYRLTNAQLEEVVQYHKLVAGVTVPRGKSEGR